MSNKIDFLIRNGMSSQQIKDLLDRNIPMDEIVAAAERLLESGNSLGTDEPIDTGEKEGKRLTLEVVSMALQELGITVRYNQLLKEVEIRGLPECYSSENAVNVLPVHQMDYLRSCGYKGVTRLAIDGYLACVADQNRFNPIRKYLESVVWDGEDRFERIFCILGVTDIKFQTYITKWFIQCVALGLNDEKEPIGADSVLVLQGEQGLAKTSFFRIMSPFPRWFVEGAIIDMSNKDTILTALSGWITELGELDSTLKKQQMSLKAFVTRSEDRIRAPYARNDTRAPRRTSFCGTVNPVDYLRDETGSRRFWTVPVTNIDKKALFTLDRDWVHQVWLQAYDLYKADPDGFRLMDDEMRELQDDNMFFSVPLPWELEILNLLDYLMPTHEWEWWRPAEVADRLPGKADARQVGKALKKIVGTPPTNPPNPPKYARKLHGNTEYCLPLKHFRSNWVEKGGYRVG